MILKRYHRLSREARKQVPLDLLIQIRQIQDWREFLFLPRTRVKAQSKTKRKTTKTKNQRSICLDRLQCHVHPVMNCREGHDDGFLNGKSILFDMYRNAYLRYYEHAKVKKTTTILESNEGLCSI